MQYGSQKLQLPICTDTFRPRLITCAQIELITESFTVQYWTSAVTAHRAPYCIHHRRQQRNGYAVILSVLIQTEARRATDVEEWQTDRRLANKRNGRRYGVQFQRHAGWTVDRTVHRVSEAEDDKGCVRSEARSRIDLISIYYV
jgi:hypothetical protein